MPNDAKFGLVLGVVLVIVVAVVFFRKDLLNTDSSPDAATPSAVGPAASPASRGAHSPSRNMAGRTTALRHHVVEEGETLFSLAQRYYGDGERFIDLYQANRAVLKSPDSLPKGTELVIPDLDE